MNTTTTSIDCACVIHGKAYDWIYVDRLYNMLSRNLSWPIRMHVWTETSRSVPAPYIKHELVDWPGINGPRKAWWYKMQMFNDAHFRGRLLYFDLDVVILNNIDWVLETSPAYFWCLRDFRYIWRPTWQGINSSIMLWNTQQFSTVWKKFIQTPLDVTTRRYAGDQDFLSVAITQNERRFLNQDRIKSWRWQVFDGGMDMKTRTYHKPSTGAVLDSNDSIIVCHGSPKPHEITDTTIIQNWV